MSHKYDFEDFENDDEEDEWGGNHLGFEPKGRGCLSFCGCGLLALVIILIIAALTIQFAVAPLVQKIDVVSSSTNAFLSSTEKDQIVWRSLANWGQEKFSNISTSTIGWSKDLMKNDLTQKVSSTWQDFVSKIKTWKK